MLRNMYPTQDTIDVARALGRSRRACMIKACELGIKKTREGKRTWTAHTQLPATWGAHLAGNQRGKRGWRFQPIGSEFVSSKGEVWIKVAATGNKNTDWKLKPRVVMAAQLGRELEPNEVVTVVDGELHLRTKQDVMQQVSIHNQPKIIRDLYRAKGQVVRAINRRNKK